MGKFVIASFLLYFESKCNAKCLNHDNFSHASMTTYNADQHGNKKVTGCLVHNRQEKTLSFIVYKITRYVIFHHTYHTYIFFVKVIYHLKASMVFKSKTTKIFFTFLLTTMCKHKVYLGKLSTLLYCIIHCTICMGRHRVIFLGKTDIHTNVLTLFQRKTLHTVSICVVRKYFCLTLIFVYQSQLLFSYFLSFHSYVQDEVWFQLTLTGFYH